MHADLDDRAIEVFQRAADVVDPLAQLRFARAECGDDAALFGRVAQLLTDHHAAGTNPELKEWEQGRVEAPEVGGYKLLEKIGDGGFGTVYRAVDAATGREVAVKVLRRTGGTFSRSSLNRFAHEMRLLSALKHPHICPVYGGGETRGPSEPAPWVAMELLKGHNLRDAARHYCLDRRQRVLAWLLVCDAVAYLHSKEIAHNDLKPSNVMVGLGPDGPLEVRLIDFGLAQSLEDGQSDVPRYGSPAYRRPDAERGRDDEEDVFALGKMLECLLTDRYPHPSDQPQPVHGRMTPTAKVAMAAIIARSVSAKPAEAYPDVRSLVVDVRRCLAGEKPLGAKTRKLSKDEQRVPESRLSVAIVLCVFTGIVVNLAASFFGWFMPGTYSGSPERVAPTVGAIMGYGLIFFDFKTYFTMLAFCFGVSRFVDRLLYAFRSEQFLADAFEARLPRRRRLLVGLVVISPIVFVYVGVVVIPGGKVRQHFDGESLRSPYKP